MPSPDLDRPIYAAKAELFRALGSPVRIRILELLVDGAQPVSTLGLELGLEPSSLSQHLAVLRRTGMISSIRSGNSVTYKLAGPAVGAFLLAARAVLTTTLERSRDALEEIESSQ